MANTDYAFGFIPYDNVIRQGLYVVPTLPTIGIFKNDLLVADISTGALATPFGYMPPVLDDAQPSDETKILGSVLSVFDEDMNPLSYIEALRAGDDTIAGYVMIADHPDQQFVAQANSALGVNAVGDNADISGVAGNTTNGISKAEIHTEIGGQGNLLLIKPHELDDVTLTNCRWIVQIAEHYYGGTPLAGG